MSFFRALKARFFTRSENGRDLEDVNPQSTSIATPAFYRHFSLNINTPTALATSSEEDIVRGIKIYHYDSPQIIELLGWETAMESCTFHDVNFNRLELGHAELPELATRHYWLDEHKVCSITPDIGAQKHEQLQVELNNIDELTISRFSVTLDFIVQGDIQDYASLTGKLNRTIHQLEANHSTVGLRIISQTPGLTQAVESNYFGERNGISRQFDALGTLLFEGNFTNDQQLGLQTWFHHTGNIDHSEERHANGMFITRYHDNGQIRETAELDSEGAYINTLTRFYASGQMRLTRPMLANKIHGIEYLYYEDGALEAELYYEQGHETKELWYHQNGMVKQKIIINEAGKALETFYDNGQPEWSEQFNPEGKLQGLRQEWHPNGQLAKQLNFEHGKEQGDRQKWYPNGQLEEKIHFIHGKQQGTACWYYDNGQLSLEIDLENGLREGLFRSYYRSGVLSAEGQYKNNLSVAPFIEYYENQQMQMYLPHTQGNRDGTARWFYEDGTIRTISEYEIREGQGYLRESSFYNEQGVLKSYQSHSNTRCGYHLENNQREYYQEGIPDTRIEYYEDGAIRWLLTRVQGDVFSSKTLSAQGVILETGTIQIIGEVYLDIDHWQRFTPQGQLLSEVWLDEQGQMMESRHYFDLTHKADKSTKDEPHAETLATDATAPILSYHLKFDPTSKLYAMKRYHSNSHVAEEGNLRIQEPENFWVGIHNQYDDKGNITLSQGYTMEGELIENSTGTMLLN